MPLAATVAVFATIYVLLSVYKHWHFGSGFDLAIFDQAVWHLSRFEIPASSIRGFPNLFGDHFHPILLVLAPLYRIAPAAETLIVTQAVLPRLRDGGRVINICSATIRLGRPGFIAYSMAKAALACGADGILVEVHEDPAQALSDGRQSLYPEQFAQMVRELKTIAAAIGKVM